MSESIMQPILVNTWLRALCISTITPELETETNSQARLSV